MRRQLIMTAGALAAALWAWGPALSADDIVDHPDKLTFEDLDYGPPKSADYRHALKCGATAYVAENHELPTFEINVVIGTGSLYEPQEKAGLAEMTGYLMRNGGIEGLSSKDLDERLALLAGEVSVRIEDSQGSARLFCLSKDIDAGLDLFAGVLHTPVFDQAALVRRRGDLLSEMQQRNASTQEIEQREWLFLLYGDHPCTNRQRATEQSIRSITREDLIAFHREYFFPANFVIAVSGDFRTGDILRRLDEVFAGWANQDLTLPQVADQIPDPKPGVYMIKKEDVNQSSIRVGHVGVKRDIPDQYALSVMNDILGGGGFTSRIVSRVRSDEGLAYNAGSAFDRPVLYPGTFRAWFQTKHATAAFGTRLIVEEITRIRTDKCNPEVVENAKASLLGEMINLFSSKSAMVNTFASDHYTGRPDDYWQDYSQNVRAVTADDVLAVAQKYLHPDKLVFLVIGDPDAAEKGSDKHPEHFSDFGPITVLPLRDPMTLEAQ